MRDSGMKTHWHVRTRWMAAILALIVSPMTARALDYFNDDFSTFTAGNLAGQQGWVQFLGSSNQPLQVNNGQVQIPFGQTADNQDAAKDLASAALTLNSTVLYSLTIRVNNAPVVSGAISSTSYFAALLIDTVAHSNTAANFANFRLTAKDKG